MSTDIYRNRVVDTISEINKIAKDELKAGAPEFDRGYRAGIMVIIKAFPDEILAFGLSDSLELIDADAWFRGEGDDLQS